MQSASDTLYIVEKSRTKIPEGIVPSDFLAQFGPISDRLAKFINARTFLCHIPKGKMLMKEGMVCPYMFLIHKGLFRAYMLEGRTEITTWISYEGELVSSISSFFSQKPAIESIQALEDSYLVALSYEDLETAYKKFPELNYHVRIILQILYQKAEERAYLSRLTKASNRYQYFAENRPDLLSRVPLKYIASHLGMTLETLSRLRGAITRPEKDAI
jgi:CRP-like cAMP-binding protein